MKKRSDLNFQSEVKNAFCFLVKDFEFACVLSEENEVQYESNKIYIKVNHGDYDFCVSVYFGRIKKAGEKNEMYDFSIFLEMVNPTLEKNLGDMIASTPNKLSEIVAKVANALRAEGLGIIEGDDRIFDQMKGVKWWHFHPESLSKPNLKKGLDPEIKN